MKKTYQTLIILTCLNFVTYNYAQTKVIDDPEFIQPELTVLALMNGKIYTNPNHLIGDISEATRWHYTFEKDVEGASYKSEEKSRFNRHNRVKSYHYTDSNGLMYKEREYIEKESDIKFIKKIDTYKKEKRVVAYNDYGEYTYLFKGDKIIQKLDYDEKTNYYYKNNKLVKIINKNDYDIALKIEKVIYKKNKISSKIIYNYESQDVVVLDSIQYQYQNELLISYTKTSQNFIPLNTEKPIDKLNYTNSKHVKVVDFPIRVYKANYEYNSKNELIKATEVAIDNSVVYEFERTGNTLIINAAFPEKRQYVYTFDEEGNPKEILSYVLEKNIKWLHKKTVFQIRYK